PHVGSGGEPLAVGGVCPGVDRDGGPDRRRLLRYRSRAHHGHGPGGPGRPLRASARSVNQQVDPDLLPAFVTVSRPRGCENTVSTFTPGIDNVTMDAPRGRGSARTEAR